MVRFIKTIWNCFYSVKILLNIVTLRNSKYRSIQRFSSIYLRLGLIVLILSFAWSFYKSGKASTKIERGLKLLLTLINLILYLLFNVNYNAIDDILVWIESLYRKYGQIGCFQKCKKISTQASVILIWIMPTLAFLMAIVDCIVTSIVKGKWESSVLSPSPFGFYTIVVYIFYNGGIFLIYTPVGATNAIMFITILHLRTTLEYMQQTLRNLTPQCSRNEFQNIMTKFVDTHCELIKYQQVLFSFSYFPVMAFEVLVYSLFLLLWIAVFFVHELLFIGTFAFGLVLLYVILCGLNAQLADAFDDLKEALYDLDWYNMRPQQRNMLLTAMVIVGNPKQMRCGPFHIICYEEFATILNRVYKYGLFITNFYA